MSCRSCPRGRRATSSPYVHVGMPDRGVTGGANRIDLSNNTGRLQLARRGASRDSPPWGVRPANRPRALTAIDGFRHRRAPAPSACSGRRGFPRAGSRQRRGRPGSRQARPARLSRQRSTSSPLVELVETACWLGVSTSSTSDAQSRVRAALLMAPITAFCAAVVIDSCMPTPQITRVSSPCPISVST